MAVLLGSSVNGLLLIFGPQFSSEELLRFKLDQISKFLTYASWSPGVLSGYVASDPGVQGELCGPWVFLPE